MQPFLVHSVGLCWQNGANDVTDRPQGVGSWQIHHFHDAVLIRIDNEIIEAPAHSCLLFPPHHPQWFKAAGRSFADDWLGVEGDVETLVQHYHLPVARAFAIANPTDVERCWREIHREWQERPPFSQEALIDHISSLIRLMTRGMRAAQHDPNSQRRQAIIDLRERLRRQCHEEWSIPDMAEELGLSNSRFSICYKQVCGESPQRDLIAFRMQRAMELLLLNEHRIAEVAELCGFSDPLYFSRVFRRHYGRSPSTIAPGHSGRGHHRQLSKRRS